MNEKEIRKLIRAELVKNAKLNELDLILPKQKDWAEEASELRKVMVDLLKHIQDEEYEDGLKTINSAISKLNTWKNKIEKLL
jgi:hypothetical protein